MTNVETLKNYKDKIISSIRLRGPSLPVQLAKTINQPPLFTSAFLSELLREDRVKISDMKVGSSPLYFIQGQEYMLERFIEHLNKKEREAFTLLKENKLLDDEKQEPAIRVALRSIKDFAHPKKIRIGEETKILWKYFTIPDTELKSLLQETLSRKEPEKEKPIRKAEAPSPSTTPKTETNPPVQAAQQSEPPPPQPAKKPRAKKQKITEHKFPKNIKEYLSAKDIEILSVSSEKKKELTGKVRIDTLFGKQSYFLIAKDKKKISQDDLNLALQKAQAEKMPSLFLSSGELDKKALPHLKDWQNLIKFEKIKI